MTLIKDLVAGMLCVSFCMADISGIVTDTGTTPIPGAIVRLEKGGQTATTGAAGIFTLGTNIGISSGNAKLLPNGLPTIKSGNLIAMTIAERSAVEVATFDLNGKALASVHQTLETGSHIIALPQRGAGVYLYKVKTGNRVFVIKGNSVNGISSGCEVSSRGLPSNTMAKQSRTTSAINDVVAVTKTGYLNYRVVVTNSDTSGITVKMIASAGTLTDTDGNVYQTLKVGNQEWMAENLRVTKYNDGSAITKITSNEMWDSCDYANFPAYCYYENTTNTDSIRRYGALYNWYIVNPANPKKIAPTGWHVPSDAEWDTLQNFLIANGYNWDGTNTGNGIAKALAVNTVWYTYKTTGTVGCDVSKNNSSGFSGLPGGCRSYDGDFLYQSYIGHWWSITENGTTWAYHRNLHYDRSSLYKYDSSKSNGFSVRLLRD